MSDNSCHGNEQLVKLQNRLLILLEHLVVLRIYTQAVFILPLTCYIDCTSVFAIDLMQVFWLSIPSLCTNIAIT